MTKISSHNQSAAAVIVLSFLANTSPARGNGEPEDQDDYDFELVFRETQQMNYVNHTLNLMWIAYFTVCAWIHTPDVQQNKKMTIISVLTRLDDDSHKALTVQIDGQGNVYFSYGPVISKRFSVNKLREFGVRSR